MLAFNWFRFKAKNDTSNYDALRVTRGTGRERRSVFVFNFTPTLPHNRPVAGGADQTLDSLALGEDRTLSRTHSPIRWFLHRMAARGRSRVALEGGGVIWTLQNKTPC